MHLALKGEEGREAAHLQCEVPYRQRFLYQATLNWVDLYYKMGICIVALLLQDAEDVSGMAVLNLKTGKKLEHNGIRVELVGQVGTACFLVYRKPICLSSANALLF